MLCHEKYQKSSLKRRGKAQNRRESVLQVRQPSELDLNNVPQNREYDSRYCNAGNSPY
jgi:hypothetical protein